ncbi:MAG TPA: FAD-dependent oxidoreductase [Phototrophicaceae bacterium]|nr:FAD-dependent oxidoreductase [Phototrophicaceae bacterium]
MTDFDVAIIGGGLAGGSTAIRLAQAGWRVGLFEAKSYPRHKVCGEFLSPECDDLLGELGVNSQIQALKPAIIDRIRITAPNETTWQAHLPRAGSGLSRYVLDAMLAEQAAVLGVAVYPLTTVTDFHGNLDATFLSHHPIQQRQQHRIGPTGTGRTRQTQPA